MSPLNLKSRLSIRLWRHKSKSDRREAFRYLLITAESFFLNLGLAVLLHEWMGLAEELAFAIALIVVMVNNFLFLRYYIFRSVDSNIYKQFLAFVAASGVFRGGEYLAFLVIHTALGVHYAITILFTLALSFVIKFFVQRNIIFRKKQTAA